MATDNDDIKNDAQPQATGAGFFSILWRRKALVLFGFTVGLVAGLLFYLQKPPTFESKARLVVIKKRPDALPMQNSSSSGASQYIEDYVSTQEALIKSEVISLRAADKLRKQTLRMPPPNDDYVGFIATGLKVGRDKDSASGATNNVLTISFAGPAPEDCMLVVNAVIEGYRDFLTNAATGIGEETYDMLMKASARAATELQKTEADWTKNHADIRDKNIMTVSDLKAQIGTNQFEYGRLEREAIKLDTQSALIDKVIADGGDRAALMLFLGIRNPQRELIPDLPKTPAETMFSLKLQLVELQQKFGPEHPEVLALKKRMEMVEDFLNTHYKPRDRGNGAPDPLDLYKQVLKQDIEANRLQRKSLAERLVQDRDAVQSLDSFMVRETLLSNQVDRFRKRLDNFDERKFALDQGREAQLFNATVITRAQAGGKVSPILITTLALSGFLGLVLGGGMSYLAELSDKSFRSIDEVRQRLGVPVIGQVPALPPFEPSVIEQNPLDPMLVVHHAPKSIHAEAYRGVRTSLYFSTRGKGHQVIQVTSPNPGDGKSTLTANLAASIAQSGKRVILIDCDFRKPRVHKIFGLGTAEVGLASVIAGEAELESAIYTCEVPGLSILPCGPRPANPADLLTSALFSEILDEIKKDYDFVLIDTPPMLAVSDPSVVAPRVDGVILTIRMIKHSRPMAQQATERLSILGANLLGVVVNGMDEARSAYGYGYGYGYGYNYAYAYGDDAESSTDLLKSKSR